MRNTTLCYIDRGDAILMLHRVKKAVDPNHDKWLGVGGKCEETESPEECVCREVWEETGFRLHNYHFHGVVTFVSDEWETEQMYLFSSKDYSGEMIECEEGDLEWIPKEKLMDLNLWEGDRIFLKYILEGKEHFNLKFLYRGDRLEKAVLDGEVVLS